MVVITFAEFKQNVYETLYDLINSNVTSATLVGGYTGAFENLPSLVLGKPIVNPVNQVVNGGLKTFEGEVTVNIFSNKNKTCDSIGDEIRSLILNNESSLFTTNGLYDLNFVEDDGGENVVEGKQVHNLVFTMSFKWDVRI